MCHASCSNLVQAEDSSIGKLHDYEAAVKFIDQLRSFVPKNIMNLCSNYCSLPTTHTAITMPSVVVQFDISGFTQLTADYSKREDGPEIISQCLNNYFGMIIGVVEEFGGDFVKSAGDAIFCTFSNLINTSQSFSLEWWTVMAIKCALKVQKEQVTHCRLSQRERLNPCEIDLIPAESLQSVRQ